MIPFYDSNPTKSVPVLTGIILAANIIVFLAQEQTGEFDKLLFMYGATPLEIINSVDIRPQIPIPVEATLFTSMFMHGNFVHLAGNMLYLWIFGDNVEDVFGRAGFVGFYLLCGLCATLSHVFQYGSSDVPLVGASGAISGILAAYMVAFPRAKVYTFFWFIVFIRIVPLPAWFIIGVWFLMQISNIGSGGQIAWGAHVGGFVAGLVLYAPFKLLRMRTR